MYQTVNEMIILFFIYSIIGWLLEIFYRTIKNKKILNPGVLTGPYVPIYGFSGILILQICFLMQGQDLLLKLVIYISLISFIEYVTGEFLLLLFNKRYWDYTDNRLNLRGHVCLRFSIIWGFIAVIFEYTAMPLSIEILNSIPNYKIINLNYAIASILITDFIVTTRVIGKFIFFLNNFIHQFFINNNRLNFNKLLTIAQNLQLQSQRSTINFIKKNEKFWGFHIENQKKLKDVVNDIALRLETILEMIKKKL